MVKTQSFFLSGLVVISCMAGLTLAAQSVDPAAIQLKLNAQFKLTRTTADRTDIVTPGDVVEIQKPGLIMYAVFSPLPPSNTYKNGKIGQGWSGFGKDLSIGLLAPGGATAADYPHRPFVAGEKCWITGIQVQKDGVLFQLYSDPYDNIRYYANLKINFPNKKQVPSVEDAMQLVAEVLTAVPQDNQGGQPAQDGPNASFAGEYLLAANGQHFFLLPDGTCTITTPGVPQPAHCQFTIDGEWLAMGLKIGNNSVPFLRFKIQDGRLYMNGMNSMELVRQGGPPAPTEVAPAPAPMPEIAPPPPPPMRPAADH